MQLGKILIITRQPQGTYIHNRNKQTKTAVIKTSFLYVRDKNISNYLLPNKINLYCSLVMHLLNVDIIYGR